MASPREKFATQVQLPKSCRSCASSPQSEGAAASGAVDEALADPWIREAQAGEAARDVMAPYQASHETFAPLYKEARRMRIPDRASRSCKSTPNQIERYGGTQGRGMPDCLEAGLGFRPQTGYYADLIGQAASALGKPDQKPCLRRWQQAASVLPRPIRISRDQRAAHHGGRRHRLRIHQQQSRRQGTFTFDQNSKPELRAHTWEKL